MIVDEIIATCSHPKIAGAALRSLGRAFVEEIGHDARANGLPPDAFVALARSSIRRAREPSRPRRGRDGRQGPRHARARRPAPNHQGFFRARSAARADGRVMIDRVECGATGLG